jgi:AcrR family transcriptional regulator
MAKAGSTSRVEKATEGATADRLIQGAIESLRHDGFAGASARAIANRAGCNQALIFYHFGTVNGLLLAALDETSKQRRRRYSPMIEQASTLGELAAQAEVVLREDLTGGHIKVLAEMIAGASATPGLGPAVAERIRPWIDVVEAALTTVMRPTPLAGLVPPRQAAFAVVALYLGVEMLTELDGETEMAESLLDQVGRFAALVDSFANTGTGQ